LWCIPVIPALKRQDEQNFKARAKGMTQGVERLPSHRKSLSSNPTLLTLPPKKQRFLRLREPISKKRKTSSPTPPKHRELVHEISVNLHDGIIRGQ
jgi:hypothetical protein